MDEPAAASPSNSTGARLRNLLRGWQQRFGLDLRALALFRILLGLLLLVDLATRLTDLRVFYSDAGVLPRVDLLGRVATGSTPWLVSLHMVSGLWGVQLLLFAVAAFCAFCLMIGHRTRLFTFLSWVLLVSLHNRNLTILNAGDLLFRVLLFWSLFLPLGARCSVDAAMREPARDGPEKGNDRTWSVPAFCFMAQVTILYWATALLKNHPVWTGDRTAVWYALQLDYMALPLAVLMRELPAAWLELMTRTTLHVEFLVPVLIWIPFLVGPLRLAACVVMIGMHLAFAATLQIGLFSYICSAMWLALLPPRVWDRLFARFRRDPRAARDDHPLRRRLRILPPHGSPAESLLPASGDAHRRSPGRRGDRARHARPQLVGGHRLRGEDAASSSRPSPGCSPGRRGPGRRGRSSEWRRSGDRAPGCTSRRRTAAS